MTNTTHTPGPWRVNGKRTGAHSGELYVMAGEGYDSHNICLMKGGVVMHRPEQEANARLIAAAPQLAEDNENLKDRCATLQDENRELLEALKDLAAICEKHLYPCPDKPDSEYGRLVKAQAAIAKAEGK